MAINLKPATKFTPSTNPIQSFQSPVEDFLAPFKKTKSDLESKIAQISSGSNPTPITKPTPDMGWADQYKQDFKDFYIGKDKNDPTTSGLYQALAPNEDIISNIGQAVKDTSQNLQNVGQTITSTTNELGNFIQNKVPGLEQAKQEGKYLSKNQVLDFMNQNSNLSDDELVQSMADLEKEGYFFEGYNDQNSETYGKVRDFVPQLTGLTDIAGATVKGVGSIFGLGAEALGGTMEGVGNVSEGNTGLGVSQIAGQVPNIAMTGFNAVAPGAGAALSSAFATDPGQAIMAPVGELSTDISRAGLDLTGMDQNSEEYQNYLKGASGTLPLLAGAGVAKTFKAYTPEIKTGFNKTSEFVKENAPIIGEKASELAKKTGEIAKTGVEKVKGINIKNPVAGIKTSKQNVIAKTEAGTEFTVEQTPTIGKNITDKAFNKENEILAQQSVFPKATKEKTPQARLDSAEIALNGVKQLYEDTAQGHIKSDIHTMGGGVDGIQEGLDFHGSNIGRLTKNNSIVDTGDLTPKLAEVTSNPFASLNPDMHSLVTKVVDAFNQAGNKADIATIQNALSNIKSEIFGNGANIAKLYKTESGRALNDFLKSLEERFQKTIEETSGNSAELAKAKQAYSRYKKIEKDLTDSYMVELRNQGKGITGTAGKVAGLYEILSNPSISGILKAVALKQAGETMQYYKSRGGNWETLIRNLDREAVQRSSTTNTPKNDTNSKSNSSNMDNQKPLALDKINNQGFGIKPKPLSNESKVIKPTTGNTIPEGYTKNAFGEIIKKPGYKNGGFIKIPGGNNKISNEYNKIFENVVDELKSSETASIEGKKYGLSPEEVQSIYEGYTNPYTDRYTDINLGHRRGETMDKYTKITSDMMDIALSKINPHKGEVYRGISRNGNTGKLIEKMSPGDTFTDKGFLSSSKSLDEAQNFSLKGGIIMRIKSKSGKDISKMSYSPEEMEVLFPRNTTMKFLGKNGKGHFVFQEI